jgi:exopolysaccharide biosynthesis polyprenyl glycosylphosphotransferase
MKRRTRSVIFSALDGIFALTLAIVAVVWANGNRIPQGGIGQFLAMRVTLLNAMFAIAFSVTWKECSRLFGLYQRSFEELLRPMLRAVSSCALMATMLTLFLWKSRVDGPIIGSGILFFVIGSLYETTRILLATPRLPWRPHDPDRVVILGSGRRAVKAWRELRINYHSTKHVLGFIDDCDDAKTPPEIVARLLCGLNDLSDFLLKNAVDELVVAMPMQSRYSITQTAVAQAEAAGVRVVCLTDPYNLSYSKALRERSDLFFELVAKDEVLLNAEAVKRMIDIFVAFASLLVLAPVFLAIALAVKLTSPGPVLFVQERCGYKRRTFRMYKFRSMVRDAEQLMPALELQNEAQGPLFKIKKDPRVTPLGRFLRSTSLDEVPQFWNVLKGDMSLVGPRPMSKRDVSLFAGAGLMRRFSVRPGMTGMWQISGRDSFSFDQWMAMDFRYIDNWSLALDLRILAQTLPAVMRREGAV